MKAESLFKLAVSLISLYLVTLLWNGQRFPHFSVDASAITDLSVESPAKLHPPHQPTQQKPAPVPAPPSQGAVQEPFIDPAILSFAKGPTQPAEQPAPSHPAPSHPAQGTHQARAPVAASLTESISNLELDVGSEGTAARADLQSQARPAPQNVTPIKQSSRRGRRGNADGYAGKQGAAASTNPKSKGWRQTAFVEPASSPTMGSPEHLMQPGPKLRKSTGRRAYAEDLSGWATEDATDIQELGDFDFQSNLSKFDKRRVFEEIRNDDNTADEARLVSFNRKAKPGTNGGKNLHWTENVLDTPQESDGCDDVEVIGDTRHSGENLSGRDLSRASARAVPTRKGSATLGHPTISQATALGRAHTSRTTSPRPGRSSISPLVGSNVSGASLRLTTTNRSCPTMSPLQTLEVEQIALAEFGLTEDIITENAGRGIAEAAVGLLSDDAAAPTMLILTGNHRTGARAISAARHLRNRGHRVSVCLLGLEHEAELLESCRKQLEIFRKIGGRVMKWEDLSTRLSMSELAPDLVIDALFGMHIAFDDLRTDDQAVAFEMISWVNRSNVEVLSVDIPSGMSASSGMYRNHSTRVSSQLISKLGEATMVDGGQLSIQGASVVCLGAPKTGVLNALLSGEAQTWNITVADIGIPQIVWRKYGTRRRHGIDFGNRWVVPLRYQTMAS